MDKVLVIHVHLNIYFAFTEEIKAKIPDTSTVDVGAVDSKKIVSVDISTIVQPRHVAAAGEWIF